MILTIVDHMIEFNQHLNLHFNIPSVPLTTRYFRGLFPDIQVIVPRRRIQFRKLVDGVEVPVGGAASTACIFAGDSGCRGTSYSLLDGRFYHPF